MTIAWATWPWTAASNAEGVPGGKCALTHRLPNGMETSFEATPVGAASVEGGVRFTSVKSKMERQMCFESILKISLI
jgi:hypothetical protein